jgi:hypothetical protein
MAKFIKIRNRLINVDKVYDFMLCGHAIYVFYSANEEDYASIEFNNDHEAELVFEDISHLIDNTRIPQWVRGEVHEPIPCKPEYFNPDYGYDELPL